MRRPKLRSLALLPPRSRLGLAAIVLTSIAATILAVAYVLQTAPSRHIVLASGLEDGLLHQHARRYIDILARSGVTVEERITNGPADNLRLLQDPKSGVDIGFTQGGLARTSDTSNVMMLASLYYVPLWIFHRKAEPLNFVNELRDHRVAVGVAGSGARSLSDSVFELNGLSSDNVKMQPLSNLAALLALRSGDVDAAIFVDGADNPAVWNALRDPSLSVLSYSRAEAYRRRLNFISTLKLPPGVIDLADNIPEKEVDLIGTKEMLVARKDLHPAITHLLIDAAREIHGKQGLFEDAGEFPSTTQVDLTVSTDADQHRRFGRTILYQYMPFWIAALGERSIIVLLPLAAILFPLFHYLPQLVRWHVRSRIFRWYGELAMLERDVAARTGDLPIDKWLTDLTRIEDAVSRIHTPTGFASEAYTLREHIGLVRRAIIARNKMPAPAGAKRGVGSEANIG
jgi:TRAP-type uncharacterized transport system substrate-binding protein